MELLKELCEESGAPGFEDRIRAIYRREVEAFRGDEPASREHVLDEQTLAGLRTALDRLARPAYGR